MNERRIAPRRRILKAGRILFNGGGIDCTVRNISETGAALEVASPVGIPQDVILVVEADKFKRECQVVWRKEKRIGLFLTPLADALQSRQMLVPDTIKLSLL